MIQIHLISNLSAIIKSSASFGRLIFTMQVVLTSICHLIRREQEETAQARENMAPHLNSFFSDLMGSSMSFHLVL